MSNIFHFAAMHFLPEIHSAMVLYNIRIYVYIYVSNTAQDEVHTSGNNYNTSKAEL